MSKKMKNLAVSAKAVVDQTVAATVVETPKEPTIKVTPVEERKYQLLDTVDHTEPLKFRGKQRQAVYDVLKEYPGPMTIDEVAAFASDKGLTAKGGVTPSVRYHLHHMAIDKIVEVTNPTITIE
jgi:hypothetical protein